MRSLHISHLYWVVLPLSLFPPNSYTSSSVAIVIYSHPCRVVCCDSIAFFTAPQQYIESLTDLYVRTCGCDQIITYWQSKQYCFTQWRQIVVRVNYLLIFAFSYIFSHYRLCRLWTSFVWVDHGPKWLPILRRDIWWWYWSTHVGLLYVHLHYTILTVC